METGGELEEEEQEAGGGELGTAAGGLEEEGGGQARQEDWMVVSQVGCRGPGGRLMLISRVAEPGKARGCSTNNAVSHSLII